VIPGDGIGPEIMTATLRCLDALNCDFEYELKQAGLVALNESGELVPQETLDSIRQNRIVLKGPLTTPDLGGHGDTVSMADAVIDRIQA